MSESKRARMRRSVSSDQAVTRAVGHQLSPDEQAGSGTIQVLQLDRVALNPSNDRQVFFSKDWMAGFRQQLTEAVGEGAFREEDLGWLDKGYELVDSVAATADRKPDSVSESRVREQLTHVLELAHSIAAHNLMQPVIVFRDETGYVVTAGDCRTLAHVLLGRASIRANVRERSESALHDRVGSLVENLIREDLSLAERLRGIHSVIEIYEEERGKKISARQLHELIYESERTCSRYLNILRKTSPDILDSIWSGELTSLREVESAKREYADSQSRGEHIEKVEQDAPASQPPVQAPRRGGGQPRSKVRLGTVDNPRVVQMLVESSVPSSVLDERFGRGVQIDWDDLETAQAAWNLALEHLGRVAGGGDSEGVDDNA